MCLINTPTYIIVVNKIKTNFQKRFIKLYFSSPFPNVFILQVPETPLLGTQDFHLSLHPLIPFHFPSGLQTQYLVFYEYPLLVVMSVFELLLCTDPSPVISSVCLCPLRWDIGFTKARPLIYFPKYHEAIYTPMFTTALFTGTVMQAACVQKKRGGQNVVQMQQNCLHSQRRMRLHCLPESGCDGRASYQGNLVSFRKASWLPFVVPRFYLDT